MILLFESFCNLQTKDRKDEHYIASSIAEGILYMFMHTRKPVIVHQDIKPLNVMVSFSGLVNFLL